jgi:CheY-like chemotaxis protein
VVKRIREHTHGEDLKIILLSSMGRKSDAAEYAELGIAAHLAKPVKQSDLFDAVAVAMGCPVDETSLLTANSSVDEDVARRPLQIMVVEDNIVNQKVAEAMLKKRGHSVVIASNGREALDRYEKESFELILMDVQMPEMDGFEATKLIRGKEKADGSYVPIVAMTAHAMKGDRERCLAAGMDDYISKPIREAALFSVIESLANGSKDKKKTKHHPISKGELPVAQDVFDLSEAMKTVNGDKELLKEIATLFLENAANDLSKIREGIFNKDATAVERAAHSLKGSVANFGAKRAFDAAYRLEKIGREGQITAAETAELELEKELAALKSAMQAAVMR